MLLRRLSEASGVSGREIQVRQILIESLREHVDELTTDTLGNLIATKRAEGLQKDSRKCVTQKCVMVAAHMDEVGLMITRIDESGLLRFAAVGGIDNRILPATVVLIGDKQVAGVIGIPPVHLSEKNGLGRVIEAKKLGIDIGVSGKEEARRLAKPGDYAVFATEFSELDEKGDGLRTVRGKAFDDRAGCAVLVELLKTRYPFDLCGVFTVQEEVGLRGARVAAYTLDPDCAFALEATGANEIPTDKDQSPSTRLGNGPAITTMDRSFIADKRLVRLLMDTAVELELPYQIKQPGIGGTDAGAIQPTRGGVPSITVAIPCRYIHSPASILSKTDFACTVRLVQESLLRLPERLSW
ncbi:MAG: hypothetical protein CMF17_11740 [Idiomarinaceae bacterium]|nr:hypothetical protein [Idiomarinaceae bacterium]